MKTSRLIAVLIILSIPLMKCTDDGEELVFYDITGTVSLPNSDKADGALVYLTESATSTVYIASAITDADGAYSFQNLSPMDYYIFANFNTFNTNSGGRFDGVKFSSANEMVSLVNANASHNVILINEAAAGIDIDTEVEWQLDGNHSEVVFEFPYRAENGTFSGRFNDYDFTIDFNDQDLANSTITAEVNLLTVNTGRSGRDGFFTTDSSITDPESQYYTDGDSLDVGGGIVEWYSAGCLANTLGAAIGQGFDTALTNSTTATWSSTSIERYGDSYKASGDLVFNGMTSSVDVYFRFIDGYVSAERQYSSFEAMFEFRATTDHAISASQVEDVITVWVSVQVNERP